MEYITLKELKNTKAFLVKEFLNDGETNSYSIESLFKHGKLRNPRNEDYKETFGKVFADDFCFCGVASCFEQYFTEAFERSLELSRPDGFKGSDGISKSEPVVAMAAVILASKGIVEYGTSITFSWIDHYRREVLLDIYGIIKHGKGDMRALEYFSLITDDEEEEQVEEKQSVPVDGSVALTYLVRPDEDFWVNNIFLEKMNINVVEDVVSRAIGEINSKSTNVPKIVSFENTDGTIVSYNYSLEIRDDLKDS